LLGLFCLLERLAMLVHAQATIDTMDASVHNAPMVFIAGAIALGIGLTMVLCHNVWSGGAYLSNRA